MTEGDRRRVVRAAFALALLAWAMPAAAHPTGFALLTIDAHENSEVDATFRVSGAADRARLVEVVFPEGCEERAPTTTRVTPTGVDRRFRLRCDVPLRGELALRGLPVDLQARVEVRGTFEQSAVLDAGNPRAELGGARSDDAFVRYLVLGVEHIAFGLDHVLFVLALVLLVPTPRRALFTVSAFTLGHSVTLALASLGLVDVSAAPLEACIALSVLLVAREVVASRRSVSREMVSREMVSREMGPSAIHARPELSAGLFGLLHGLGFASALSEVGLPSDALLTALFAFNLGVELGQVVLVLLGLGVLALLSRRFDAPARARYVEAPIAYVLGTVAAYWTIERVLVVLS